MRKRMTLQDKALIALEKAVEKVIEEHKKNRFPLFVWENGKVRKIDPNELH